MLSFRMIPTGWTRDLNRLLGRICNSAIDPDLTLAANPAFIPRNHRVEEALSAAVERGDYAPFTTLLNILSRPFDNQPEFAAFAEPAPEGRGCYQTFCGT